MEVYNLKEMNAMNLVIRNTLGRLSKSIRVMGFNYELDKPDYRHTLRCYFQAYGVVFDGGNYSGFSHLQNFILKSHILTIKSEQTFTCEFDTQTVLGLHEIVNQWIKSVYNSKTSIIYEDVEYLVMRHSNPAVSGWVDEEYFIDDTGTFFLPFKSSANNYIVLFPRFEISGSFFYSYPTIPPSSIYSPGRHLLDTVGAIELPDNIGYKGESLIFKFWLTESINHILYTKNGDTVVKDFKNISMTQNINSSLCYVQSDGSLIEINPTLFGRLKSCFLHIDWDPEN